MPVPKVRIGPLRSLRFPRAQQQWQYARSGRRYASEGASEKAQKGAQQLGSDMPWLIGSVVATIPAAYFIASGHKFTDPISHPLPGDNYHGEEHDEDHEEGEGDEEGEEGGDEKKDGEEGDDDESAKKDEKKEDKKDGDDAEDDQEGGDDNKESEKGGDDKQEEGDSSDEKESKPPSKKK